MRFIYFIFILCFFLLSACSNDNTHNKSNDSKTQDQNDFFETPAENQSNKVQKYDTIIEEATFSSVGFDDKIYYELLIETHLCNPQFDPSINDGSSPCSSRFFKFFSYNHKRKINDAFLLQVKAGVNNYPYRRLLIFIREDGKLILMNGIIGYLVKRISQPNKIDDLVVAIIDDLGNNNFDRYDVLLKYKDGKYHFSEAIGDLYGTFNTPELKDKATKEIQNRIKEKELIF